MGFLKSRALLTFGLELEFLTHSTLPVAELHMGNGWREMSERQNKMLGEFAVALKKSAIKGHRLPIAVICPHSVLEEDSCAACQVLEKVQRHNIQVGTAPSSCLGVYSSAAARSIPGLPAFTRLFIISKEGLSTDVPGRAGGWEAIEVSTPVFTRKDLLRGIPQLTTFLQALRDINIPIAVNTTCGLHIHTGFQGGMTLHKAKKVVTLALLLEMGLLFPLCARTREDNYWAQRNTGFSILMPRLTKGTEGTEGIWGQFELEPKTGPLLHSSPEFRRHIPEAADFTYSKWLGTRNADDFTRAVAALWHIADLPGIYAAVQDENGSRCALALCLRLKSGETHASLGSGGPWRKNPVPTHEYEGTPSTFEFRHMQMSFNLELLRNWTTIISRIMEVASLEAPEYKTMVLRIIGTLKQAQEQNSPLVWQNLLRTLRLEQQIPFWETQLQGYEAGGREYCEGVLDDKPSPEPRKPTKTWV